MYTLGIDVGSTSSKAVILKNGKELVSHAVIPLGTGTVGPEQVYQQVFLNTTLSISDIAWTVATGYGRLNCSYANQQISELSCHAKGIHFLIPDVRTIIDIGGQDAKAIRVDSNGQLINFQMNDKCAAGTGRFLEVMSRVMGLEVAELGEYDARATGVETISNTCTVFAESEVISKLSAGVDIANLVAGIHDSVARKITGLTLRMGILPEVALTGGGALNTGLVRALERNLKCGLLLPSLPQFTGAVGAALFALEGRL